MTSNTRIKSFEESLLRTLETVKKHNIPHGITITTNDLVAIFGDIHADIDTLEKAYTSAKSKNCKYYIFCGDYIDKGKDSLLSFQFIIDHFNQDPVHFIPLMGNHETLFFADLYNELKDSPNMVSLCWEVICALPIGAEIHTNGKTIFCAHGAYPRIYRPKRIHVHDEYQDVWQLVAPQSTPDDASEMIYETNNTFNISPSTYINRIYDDYTSACNLIDESPYHIHAYSKVVSKLDAIRSASESDRSKLIAELKDPEFKKYVDFFISKLNNYKSIVARIERAKQNLILLKDYIQEGDMYRTEQPEENANTYEEFVAEIEKVGTQFFKPNRFEVVRYNLGYSDEQLKQWMKDSKVNAFIRGHQLTLNCCTVVDLNTDTEEIETPEKIKFNTSSMLYITVHTTTSYAKYDVHFSVAKYCIIDKESICVVSV